MARSHDDFTASFAEVYDRYLVPMDFAPHAARLSERVTATAPRRVLETAAGTGVVTRALARILPSDVSITATDLNEPMIALAQSNMGSERILWRQADALAVPETCRIDDDRRMLPAQFLNHLPDALFGLCHDRNSAHTALGVIAVGQRPLRIGVNQGRLMSYREPVGGQTVRDFHSVVRSFSA